MDRQDQATIATPLEGPFHERLLPGRNEDEKRRLCPEHWQRVSSQGFRGLAMSKKPAQVQGLSYLVARADDEQIRLSGVPIVGEGGGCGALEQLDFPFRKDFPEAAEATSVQIKSDGF
jgi:hypothetical protein